MNGSDIAWMLISTALVLLMTPAVGFFYAGLVRSKNALNTLMMSFVSLGFVGLAWALLGYSLAFAEGGRFVGGWDYALLIGVGLEAKGTIPHLLFLAFQGTFAIITAALISGAIVERMRFAAYIPFITIWSLVVYAPVAHWVWGGGWLAQLGALDFAGGTVVHITAGTAAWVAAVMVGPRKEYARQALVPHSVPLTALGAALAWFGWFGFNGGSALGANAQAALAFVNTLLAPAATLAVWSLIDIARTGKATAVGVVTALVVGLVAVTPAAGYISPLSAILLGAMASLPSYLGLQWRARTRLDDSLDVVSAHGAGGVVGALLTGLLAQKAWGAPADGALFGNPSQLGIQAIAVLAVMGFTAVITGGILLLVRAVTPLRASSPDEGIGLDVTQHGEEAYGREDGAILVLSPARRREPAPSAVLGPPLGMQGDRS
ncbi:MAG TPA: ammonium transporter [Vicinamibacterales bacterium]|nr:ammonium transporter [Vicinamibacterales bacterium]